ncbi:hypothetical protein [Sphingorhabdus contaminans]|uniref:hypothetical protein n=1 Tax=Sphingorhabdus contaminans TaxID=1343899 RepID=UPI003D293AB3
MNFCTYTLVIALLLAGCLPPKGDRDIPPRFINEAVMEVDGWDMGCDNLGNCIAIGALPPRKAKMEGIRGALRIAFNNAEGKDPELTIIPLDFEQRLPDVKPSPRQAALLLSELRNGRLFMLSYKDADDTVYYLPGRDFPRLEALHRQWLGTYQVRLVQQEPIMPEKGTMLHDYRAPALTNTQLAECTAPNKGSVDAAWDVGDRFRLLRYVCSPAGKFNAEMLWFTLDKQGGKLTPIGVDEAIGPKADGKAAGLYNAYFEPTQGLLITRKSAGSDDCGLLAVYAATSSGFILVERREARNCIGLYRGDWVRTYRNPAVIMPDYW